MGVARSLALFVVAAIAEIGGAWLVWQGVREHRGVAFIGVGIAALAAYGFVATLQDDANFGRILAAYGGIFVAGSLRVGYGARRLQARPIRLHRRGDLLDWRRRDHVGTTRRRGLKAPEGSTEWAQRDSNPRHLPCKGSALAN